MATIKIPPVLRPSVGGEKQISASGASVGEVLRDLAASHPATESQLFAADGELNRYVNVYLNDEDVRVLGGLDTAVSEQDLHLDMPGLSQKRLEEEVRIPEVCSRDGSRRLEGLREFRRTIDSRHADPAAARGRLE